MSRTRDEPSQCTHFGGWLQEESEIQPGGRANPSGWATLPKRRSKHSNRLLVTDTELFVRPHSQVFHPKGGGGSRYLVLWFIQKEVSLVQFITHTMSREDRKHTIASLVPRRSVITEHLGTRLEAYSHDLIVHGKPSRREWNEAGGRDWE